MRVNYFHCLLILVLYAGCSGYALSEEPPSAEELNDRLLPYQELITEDFLYSHLSVIAHDSLKGRFTGMPGQKEAAKYLSDYYQELGLIPVGDDDSYYQFFNLDAERTDSLVYSMYQISGSDTLLANHSVASSDTDSDFLQVFGGSVPLKGDLVYAGFGVNDTERDVLHLNGLDIQDRWVVIFEDIPHIIDGDTLIDPSHDNNQRFMEIVSRGEANGVLVITDRTTEQFTDLQELNRHLISQPENMRLQYLGSAGTSRGFPRGYFEIHPELAVELLGLETTAELEELRSGLIDNIRDFRPQELSYILDYQPYHGTVEIETENVVAFFEGGDPELKDEVVVLTAHYDHIGISQPDETGDYINNGADDNGSGTVALMAVANALQAAAEEGVRTRRSILFLHVSAEEVGLLGSRYYSDHPIFPIENTVASYNADMIGRSTTNREEARDTDYIFIIGGEIISSQLDSLVHLANDQSVNLELDYTYNDLDDPNQFYRRSDHWNFGRLEVPFVFFFTGVHEDYHQPGDTVDKIDFPKLTQTSRLVYSSILQVANFDGRPEVDNEQFIEITRNQPR